MRRKGKAKETLLCAQSSPLSRHDAPLQIDPPRRGGPWRPELFTAARLDEVQDKAGQYREHGGK